MLTRRGLVERDRQKEEDEGGHDEWGLDPGNASKEVRGQGDGLRSHDPPPDERQCEHEPTQDEEEVDADVTVLEERHQTRIPIRSGDDRAEGGNDHESAGRETRNRKEMNGEHDADREEA